MLYDSREQVISKITTPRKPEISTWVTLSGHEQRRIGTLPTIQDPCTVCKNPVDSFSCETLVCANCSY